MAEEDKSIEFPEDQQDWAIKHRLMFIIGEESVSGFARRAGISESVLRKYVTGSNPGADNLLKIARASGCTIDWIVTGEQPIYRSGSIAYEMDPAGNPSEIIAQVKAYISATDDQKETFRLLRIAVEQPGSKAWFEVGKALSKIANVFPSRKK